MEKCSESTGIILVLCDLDKFLIKCQPQIIVSLFANKIFFEYLTNLIVGDKPAIPTIDEIVMSNFFFLKLISEKLLYIFIFLFLYFFLTFLKTNSSLII